jgi:glycosyltransferase involved in cell wall biosynthesis
MESADRRRLDPGAEAVDVSIVMPCLNEAATIEGCVALATEAIHRLRDEMGLSGEIVVADNGSTDGSQELARAKGARVIDIDERGYGAALRGGFAAATGRYLVMGDSDLSYDFREAVPMIAELQSGIELCMGSRFRGEIRPGAMPWKNRYIGNPILSAILRLLFRAPISDSHCGLRAMRRDAYEGLRLTSSGMEFASEMVLKSALRGLRMSEVPVTLSPDGRGRPPHLNPWRDGLRHLFYMFLLSPTWLFLLPSAVLMGTGLALLLVLLVNPEGEIVRIGRFGIGDHWAVVASSSLIIGVQTFIAGIAAVTIGAREGYLIPNRWQRAFLRRSTLSRWILAGAAVAAAGFGAAAIVVTGWAQSGFGALAEMRSMIAAFSAIVVGVQLAFGGFLLSVAAGNKLRHRAALSPVLSEA